MRRSKIHALILLCSALLVSGCQHRSQPVQRIMPPPMSTAIKSGPLFLTQAQTALARSDFAASVSFAELAVRAQPTDVVARALLAKAYLGGGRVHAAEQAYGDLLAATPQDAKARLGRALARLAVADKAGALADLDALNDATTNADAGLAYAIAGDSARGVTLLTQAARSVTATPRIRQNLALALAMDGQWAQARAVAAQDLDAVTVDARVREWTALVANRDPASRTAHMLAIVPRLDDQGRPAALAWQVPETVQTASVAEAPLADVEQIPPMQTEPPVPAELLPASEAILAPAVEARLVIPSEGRWVVQLGAYAHPEQLASAWNLARISRLASRLAGFEPIRSTVFLANRGRLHRLSVGGFADRHDAIRLCEALRQAGGECLIRDAGHVAPSTQVAARFQDASGSSSR